MKTNSSNTNRLADHFFRHNHSKMIAVLVSYFGLKQVEIAEDIVQDTLIDAMEQWSVKGIPQNPDAWLITVAKRKTINFLNRNQIFQRNIIPQFNTKKDYQEEISFNNEIITDSTLKMIFSCCHPALGIESQIALSLKTLCGFSIQEIADALLTNEVNINKRLYRAKKKFRDGSIAYHVPNGEVLTDRIGNVVRILYLMFNEGYYSKSNASIIRTELCFEAIRLQKIILDAFPDSNKSKGLLALMYLQFARFKSRLDEDGILIVLQQQDRNIWDKELIGLGLEILSESIVESKSISTYQLQAGIAAEHAIAKNFNNTNWKSIYNQYQILIRLDSNPIIKLNKAIAQFYLGDQDEAIQDILTLKSNKNLKENPLYYCTLGRFYSIINNKEKAIYSFENAIKYSKSAIEKNSIKYMLKRL